MAARSRKPKPAFVLGANNYGKSRVRLVKVARDPATSTHTVREFTVAIALSGDFTAIHCDGDNSLCLPTDTMKNTVYALAKDHPIDAIESFAQHLGKHFVSRNSQVHAARVEIAEHAWHRLTRRGREHPHAFERGSAERQWCSVSVTRARNGNLTAVLAGIEDLVLLKTTDSGFAGYPRDEYTTLPETDDRIFATSVTATWSYSTPPRDLVRARSTVREALIDTFASHKSLSVQHTLYAMGEAALKACRQAEWIRLSLPNKHCLLVNLSPFGVSNANEIFVPTDEPHGLIEATIQRRPA